MGWDRRKFLNVMGLGSLSFLPGISLASAYSRRTVIKPGHLSVGDTIGLVSPASILPDQGRYDEIKSTIKELGFKVKEGKHARDRYGNMAGNDAERAADLNSMFVDGDIDAILPYRGGWGSNRILSMIDFEAIKSHPKPLVGFSDITSLLLSIYAKTGMVTFHGPVGKSKWTPFTVKGFKNALMGNEPFTMSNAGSGNPEQVQTITAGTCEGRLLGGNLTVLTSMLGSSYLPDWEGSILFVEDVGEDYYRIDRMMTQLGLNGILNKINGFIFGRCTNCKKSNDNSLSLEQILKDHLQKSGIPAFYGSMIGHLDRMFTIPIGIEAQMDSVAGTITVLESPTS